MKKKVFISGVAGFLGSHLAEEFLVRGFTVLGIDNLSSGYEYNIPKEVIFKQADCNDIEEYDFLLENVDYVYHCAALAYEGLSVFSPHLINKNIVTATTGMLSASIKHRVKRFIFCSSMARYGNNQIPFKESYLPEPIDPYGIAKYASELLVRNLCEIHGIEYNIAVPHNIIGPKQNYSDPYRNVASIFINRMLKGQQPIVYGEGDQLRCFSDIDDCIHCLVRLGLDDNIKNEVFNIGPDEEFTTILDLAKTISELLEFKLEPIFSKGRPQEVKYATCSSDKAKKYLEYETKVSLRASLKKMITHIEIMGVKEFDYRHQIEILNEKTPDTWVKKLI